MNRIQKWIFFCVVVFLVTNGVYYAALADHDEYKKKRWYQKIFDWDNDNHDDDDHDRGEKKRRYQKRNGNDSKHYGEHYLTPANNPIFKEECGGCHFTYQPELLPSGSWNKILEGLEDHYGEVIELDPKSKKVMRFSIKLKFRIVTTLFGLGSHTEYRFRVSGVGFRQEFTDTRHLKPKSSINHRKRYIGL